MTVYFRSVNGEIGGKMRTNMFFSAPIRVMLCAAVLHTCIGYASAADCPDGWTENVSPEVRADYAVNGVGRCAQLCQNENIDMIQTSNGYATKLFADKSTIHAIGVQYDDDVCWLDLITGAGDGINVTIGTSEYHTMIPGPCSVGVYTLRYSCGAGATGTPPAAESLMYGALFSVPYQNDGNTCTRSGHRITEWSLSDGTIIPAGGYETYTYRGNRTATAVWTPVDYKIYYDCGTSLFTASTAETLSVQYGDIVTPEAVCKNSTSFNVRVGTRYTGEVVNADEPFVFNYVGNIVLEKI